MNPCPSPRLRNFLAREVKKGYSVLDLGCGTKWYWPAFKNRASVIVGVDAHRPFDPCLLVDMEKDDLPVADKSFDVVLMLDFIEHLSRETGERVLAHAKRIVREKIILLTPLLWDDNASNVEDPKSEYFGNGFDYHKSLWTVRDFEGWQRSMLWPGDKRYLGIWRPT